MDHPACRQSKTGRYDRGPFAQPRVLRKRLLDFKSSIGSNGIIDPAALFEPAVSSIDDGVRGLGYYVAREYSDDHDSLGGHGCTMKAQWKYIVYRKENGDEVIDLFGTGVIHAEYAARAGIPMPALVSAGYATSDKECFGSSISLGLNSRPRRDTSLLKDEG